MLTKKKYAFGWLKSLGNHENFMYEKYVADMRFIGRKQKHNEICRRRARKYIDVKYNNGKIELTNAFNGWTTHTHTYTHVHATAFAVCALFTGVELRCAPAK